LSRIAAHTHCQTELTSMIGRLAVWWTRQLIIDPWNWRSSGQCAWDSQPGSHLGQLCLALCVGVDLRQCTLLVKSKERLHYLLLIHSWSLVWRACGFIGYCGTCRSDLQAIYIQQNGHQLIVQILNLLVYFSITFITIARSPSFKRVAGILSGLSATYLESLFSNILSSSTMNRAIISSTSFTILLSPLRLRRNMREFHSRIYSRNVIQQLLLSTRQSAE